MTQGAQELRRGLVRLVAAFPGLHLRELARRMELTESLAAYHLDALVGDGALTARTEGGYRRFYPAGGAAPAERDRELMGLLRQAVPLQIVLFLLERPGATHGDVTAETGLAKSTVSYHLQKLVEANVIAPDPEQAGFRVVEPLRVSRLLIRWEPPDDVTDRFGELWRSFYAARSKK